MLQTDHLPTPAEEQLRTQASRLEQWVTTMALPYWATEGVDRADGGFHERISLEDGRPIDEPRRTRVVSRQIYVFATALERGWYPAAADLVEHGLESLLHRLQLPSGLFAAACDKHGVVVRPEFDLYEHAFALFALASAYRAQPWRQTLPAEAARLLTALRRQYAHPGGGFEESMPPRPPLKSNPHMHLLEAALEWVDAGDTPMSREASALADELATLALAHFIEPRTGALHEYFDRDWRIAHGAPGLVVEPGHQFEWAWLLARWAHRHQRPDVVATARALAEIGEGHGIDAARGIAVNQLDASLSVSDGSAKLWPQTERIKAWSAMSRLAATPQDKARAQHLAAEAIAGLLAYMSDTPPGRWHEVWLADGSFSKEPTRASSLYHIVCAMNELASPAIGDRSAIARG